MSNIYFTKNQLWDSVQNFREQSESDWVKCVQDLIASDPFQGHKFYIYSFVKRVDDATGVKKMYHQARLTKPFPTPGSTLLRVNPKDASEATIMWTLPNQENFKLYKEGKAFEDSFVHECVERYMNDAVGMCRPEPDDPPEEKMRELLAAYLRRLKVEKMEKRNRK